MTRTAASRNALLSLLLLVSVPRCTNAADVRSISAEKSVDFEQQDLLELELELELVLKLELALLNPETGGQRGRARARADRLAYSPSALSARVTEEVPINNPLSLLLFACAPCGARMASRRHVEVRLDGALAAKGVSLFPLRASARQALHAGPRAHTCMFPEVLKGCLRILGGFVKVAPPAPLFIRTAKPTHARAHTHRPTTG